MIAQEVVKSAFVPARSERVAVLRDGLVAGALGAATVALWFLLLDVIQLRPLHTPTVLGTLLMAGPEAARVATPSAAPIAFYTVFHVAVFASLGLGLSWLTTLFERQPMVGFVMLMLTLFLQVGFFVVDAAVDTMLSGQLGAWKIVLANLFSAVVMVTYVWRHHPGIGASLARVWDRD